MINKLERDNECDVIKGTEIKLTIFDLDGLLIDSQPLQYKAYNKVFTRIGHPISKDDWIKYWVNQSFSCQQWLELKGLSDLDGKAIREEKNIVYEGLIKTDLELKPGANGVIDRLRNQYMISIASASRRSVLDIISGKFDLTDRFDSIVSDADDGVGQQKPHPDVFLYVAAKHNIKPENCIVVGDSLSDLNGSRGANMRCVICPDSYCDMDESQFEGASRIINTLDELTEELIKTL